LPANTTLQLFEERGLHVAKLVTPRVMQVARNYFDCPGLNGVELENQPTSSGSCYGSHWEERLFEQELMTALAQVKWCCIRSPHPVLSAGYLTPPRVSR
jgi:hypothetical protein